jgi:hypothetical protein
MKTIDKLKIVGGALFGDETKKEPLGNQSIKTTYPCGCFVVYHKYAGKPIKKDETPEQYATLQADRSFFVELCKTHQP